MRVQAQFEDFGLYVKFSKVLPLRVEQELKSALRKIGDYTADEIKNTMGVEHEYVSPFKPIYVVPWADTLKWTEVPPGQPVSRVHNKLRDSFKTMEVVPIRGYRTGFVGAAVVVGSDSPYARIHELGGIIGGLEIHKGKIMPARPYIKPAFDKLRANRRPQQTVQNAITRALRG